MKKCIFVLAHVLFLLGSCTQQPVNSSMYRHVPGVVPELVFIEGMDFRMGFNCEGSSSNPDSCSIYIGSYYMSKHEITNKEFCDFLNEDSIRTNADLIKEAVAIGAGQNKISYYDGVYIPVKGFENYPVVMISWWGARRYCQWLTSLVNKRNAEKNKPYVPFYRVPSEFEWVYATALSKKQKDFVVRVCDGAADVPIDSLTLVHNIKQDSIIHTGITGMNENAYEWTDDNFYAKQSVTDYSMQSFYRLDFTEDAVVRKYGLGVSNDKTKSCGRISRLRSGFYSDTGFRIVQTYLGRSSGFEF